MVERKFKMRPPTLALVLLLVALVGVQSHASVTLNRLVRQSGGGGTEKETSTNSKEPTATSQETKPPTQTDNNQSPRLYPDLPQQPQYVPIFNGVGPHHYPAISHHHGQTPFVPFGIQMPASRLNADQQPVPFGRVLPPPKQMTPAERLQSENFANGLGRRLLSMIGIEPSSADQANSTMASSGPQERQAAGDSQQQQQQQRNAMEEALKALHNSTVLQQLNKGVNSIYGGLSKMYNSTVQEQLNLLQERFKSEAQNATNPWQQRMAEQVPQFFKQVAAKVGQAQEQLNRVWQDVSQAAQGNATVLNRSANDGAPQRSFLSSFDFMGNGPPPPPPGQNGDFFHNIGRSLGFNGPQPQMMAQQSGQAQPQQPDLGAQLRDFWQTQVQPQIGMVRGQMARVWRDLTASGALSPETIVRSRQSQSQGSSQNGSSNLVDDILKEVDMTTGSEYTLIEPKNDGTDQQGSANGSGENKPAADSTPGIKLSPQMQNRLIAMQRELNQLWMGLTNSLQGAINNVKNTVNPPVRRQFGMDAMASNRGQQEADPALNEIDGKVKDLSKLQRDADMVYDTVQQQQRQAQQRQTFDDRFKNFFNNMNVDLSGVSQLPDRIGQQFDRFGAVMGNLWNQIPERWDNFMTNMRPSPQQQQMQDSVRAKMQASSTTTTSTTTASPER